VLIKLFKDEIVNKSRQAASSAKNKALSWVSFWVCNCTSRWCSRADHKDSRGFTQTVAWRVGWLSWWVRDKGTETLMSRNSGLMIGRFVGCDMARANLIANLTLPILSGNTETVKRLRWWLYAQRWEKIGCNHYWNRRHPQIVAATSIRGTRTCIIVSDKDHWASARAIGVVQLLSMADSRTERLRLLLTASKSCHCITRTYLSQWSLMSEVFLTPPSNNSCKKARSE